MEFTASMLKKGFKKKSVNEIDDIVRKFIECYPFSKDEFCNYYEQIRTESISKYATGIYKYFSGGRLLDNPIKDEPCGAYMHQYGEIRNLIWRMITHYHLQYEKDTISKFDLKKAILYYYIYTNADEEHLDWQQAKKDLRIHHKSMEKYTEDPTDEEEQFAIMYINFNKKED